MLLVDAAVQLRNGQGRARGADYLNGLVERVQHL